ncbi:MAG TPA: DUF5703 domain-containing protein [Puia sp.]|nr:DUF5703 domain-containing protein [Puia sp.]
MKYLHLFAILFLPALSCSVLVPIAATGQSLAIDRCNITWNSPSENAAGSMPCGGGDIGLNVWVEKGDLLFYISRSGTFDENNAFLKLGRVRVRLSPNPLEGGEFGQTLVLKDGNIHITGRRQQLSIDIKVWVDVFRPVVHLTLNSSKPLQAQVIFESWRDQDRVTAGKANNANSYKWDPGKAPGGKVITHRDSIGFREDGVIFYHRNPPGNTLFDVVVRQQGLDAVKGQLNDPLDNLTFGGLLRGSDMRAGGTVTGRYLDTDFRGWRLESRHAVRHRTIDLFLATAQTKTTGEWIEGLQQTIADASTHEKTAWANTRDWWRAFWERSFIYVQSEEGGEPWQAGRNYQLFRYMLGCNTYGDYPTKFNGGLFTYDPSLTDTADRFTPDFRNWGGGTMTAQNQRLVYFPLIRSGDFDALRPQFQFYLRSLRTAELRTETYWGHKGACFSEQLENFGLPNPPEYGWNRPEGFDKGVEYNAWLEYEWDTVLEFCLMMLETERYTGKDIREYVPFIESCLRFFDQHYQYLARQRGRKPLDGEGHLILYPGSAGETYKMAYNSSSTIAGLHTLLTRLLELPGAYLSSDERKEWTTMLAQLPPLSFREFQGHPTISPARLWERVNNKECPQLYPVFPWGIYGVGRPGLDTAINTFKYDTDALKFRSYIGWKQDNIFAARLGLTEEAARLTVQKLKDSERRFPAFWGPGFDWTPDHNWGGSGMIGLQEMLLQTDGRKILLFPAWPRSWDVHFKLYAPYNTTVEATLRNGKIEMLKVMPEERRKDIVNLF